MTPARRRQIYGKVRPMRPTLWEHVRERVQALRNTWAQTPWFERILCFYIVAIGVGAIWYSIWSAQ